MRHFVAVAAFLSIIQGAYADIRSESPGSKMYDVVIPAIDLITTQTHSVAIESEARRQLKYMLGQTTWFDGSPRMNRFKIELGKPQPRADGLYTVRYSASGQIVWKENADLELTHLVLPARADAEGLKSFESKYMIACTDGGNNDDVSPESFFYYFWPLLPKCPLSKPNAAAEAGIVVRVPIHFSLSATNTTNKKPEYAKVWEDGKLVVTMIFGLADAEENEKYDSGRVEYADAFNSLSRKFKKYGKGVYGPALSSIQAKTPQGIVDIQMRLVSSIQDAAKDPEFVRWYESRTPDSDFIAYGGHAGLGNNISSLIDLGTFKPGQWQLFLLNGCDTFAHLSNELANRHAAVNPGFAASKHLDTISNGQSGYFHTLATQIVTIVQALHDRTATYGQILLKMDASQQPVVEGEEDNT